MRILLLEQAPPDPDEEELVLVGVAQLLEALGMVLGIAQRAPPTASRAAPSPDEKRMGSVPKGSGASSREGASAPPELTARPPPYR